MTAQIIKIMIRNLTNYTIRNPKPRHYKLDYYLHTLSIVDESEIIKEWIGRKSL